MYKSSPEGFIFFFSFSARFSFFRPETLFSIEGTGEELTGAVTARVRTDGDSESGSDKRWRARAESCNGRAKGATTSRAFLSRKLRW